MYQRILAPLDGSELSECTLDHVRAIAKGCNVPEVDVVTVLEPFRPSTWQAEEVVIPEQVMGEARGRYEAEIKEYVTKIEQELKKEGIAAKGVVLEVGPPADRILEYAEGNNIDLIIMSTHGRSGPSRWAFGSVADRVVRNSPAPVLVATPRGCRV
jgi:nucleotide-binding universal stress UspA family protein